MRIVFSFVLALVLLAGSVAPCFAAAKQTPKSPPANGIKTENFGERVNSLAEVTGIRFSVDGEGRARIVVDAEKNQLTFKQSAVANPNRIIVDINNAWLSPKVAKETVIGGAVKKVRAAQFDKSTVRIVAETDISLDNVLVFTLANPERLVMDFGKNIGVNEPAPQQSPQPKQPESKPQKSDAAKQKPADKGNAAPAKPPADTVKTVPTPPADKDDDAPAYKAEPPTKSTPATGKDDEGNSYDDEDNEDNAAETAKANRTEGDEEERGDERIAAIIGMKGKVICLDAGHGGPDSGAIGPTGVTEKSVTLRVAAELKKLLENEGAKVIMTRTSDKAVHSKGAKADAIEELQARCDIANKKKADVFISIHMDAFTNNTAKGTTAYYYEKGTKASKKLADAVRLALIEELKTADRGTQSCNFYVVRKTDMPAVLIELAFISNEEEEQILDSDEGITRAAQGLLDGIADYFG